MSSCTSSTAISRPSRIMPTRSQVRCTSSRSWEERSTRATASALLQHEVDEPFLHQRVQAGRGFVEHEQLRIVEGRLHEPDLLAVARATALRSDDPCRPRNAAQAPRHGPGVRLPRRPATKETSSRPLQRGSTVNSPARFPSRAWTRARSRWLSRPNRRASPLVGRSRSSSVRIVVVLPAPFGPRKPKISPSCTVRLTSSMPARVAVALGEPVWSRSRSVIDSQLADPTANVHPSLLPPRRPYFASLEGPAGKYGGEAPHPWNPAAPAWAVPDGKRRGGEEHRSGHVPRSEPIMSNPILVALDPDHDDDGPLVARRTTRLAPRRTAGRRRGLRARPAHRRRRSRRPRGGAPPADAEAPRGAHGRATPPRFAPSGGSTARSRPARRHARARPEPDRRRLRAPRPTRSSVARKHRRAAAPRQPLPGCDHASRARAELGARAAWASASSTARTDARPFGPPRPIAVASGAELRAVTAVERPDQHRSAAIPPYGGARARRPLPMAQRELDDAVAALPAGLALRAETVVADPGRGAHHPFGRAGPARVRLARVRAVAQRAARQREPHGRARGELSRHRRAPRAR